MFISLPKNIKINKEKILHIGLISVLVFGLLQPVFYPKKAFAAAATGYLQLDRMKINTTTGGSVCIKPTAAESTVQQLQISFADGSGTGGATSFAVNSTGANWTWDTTSIPPGTTAFPGTAAASTVSTGTVTFKVNSNQSLSTSNTYCLHFTGTSTLTTPTAANGNLTGTITLRDSGGTLLTNESVSYATAVISSDQIAVSATVPSTFTFALAGNSQSLSLTTTGVAAGTGSTATINTNANNGWIVWVKSQFGALQSSGTGDSISSPGTSNATPEDLLSQAGYVLDSDLTTDAGSGGTVTIDPEFNYTGTVDSTHGGGGHLVTTFQSVASSNGPAAGDVITLITRGKAGSLNKAANDYADTLTVTAAGQF